MRRIGFLLMFLAVNLHAEGNPSPERGFSSLQFLIGDWVAVTKPGEGSGSFKFAPDLQGTVILRYNHAEYPASTGRPAGTHDDLMVVYREGDPGATRAVYFDSEGHVIRYAVESGTAGQVAFVSDSVAGAPRYRLSYAALPDGNLSGKFEIAAAGKPNGFSKYLEWVAKRRAVTEPSRP